MKSAIIINFLDYQRKQNSPIIKNTPEAVLAEELSSAIRSLIQRLREADYLKKVGGVD